MKIYGPVNPFFSFDPSVNMSKLFQYLCCKLFLTINHSAINLSIYSYNKQMRNL